MSIRNFPRIPKIALRTACGEAKELKNTRSSFFSEFPDPGILLHMKAVPGIINRWGGCARYLAQGSYRSTNRYSARKNTQEMRWLCRRKNPESIPTFQAVFILKFVIFLTQNGPDLLVAPPAGYKQIGGLFFSFSRIKTAWKAGIDSGFFPRYSHRISWLFFLPEYRLMNLCEPCATLCPDPPPSVNYPRNRLHIWMYIF